MYTCCIHDILVQVRTYIHTHIHTYTHTYMQAYIHTCMHACMHTYIHTHTYIMMHSYIHNTYMNAKYIRLTHISCVMHYTYTAYAYINRYRKMQTVMQVQIHQTDSYTHRTVRTYIPILYTVHSTQHTRTYFTEHN